MEPSPADLVADTKFRVEFNSDLVYRFSFQSKIAPGQNIRRKEKKDVWEKQRSVGIGSYGNVWLHRCLTSEGQAELQAVKMITKKSLSSGGIDLFKELEAIAKFSQRKYHGLFVEYFGWYESDDSVFIVMEYIEHGDLGSCLKMPLPEDEARNITFQVLEGLEHMHKSGYVHRDLKPDNIFVVTKGPKWWVKIGDFGFSKRIKDDSSLRSMVGTLLFLAPEIQMIFPPEIDETSTLQYRYSAKVDVWSLGVMVFYMLFHEFPFTVKKPQGLPNYVNGGPFPFPTSSSVLPVSEDSRNFMLATMNPNPLSRLSASEALESNWLKQRPKDLPESTEAIGPQDRGTDFGAQHSVSSYDGLSSWEIPESEQSSRSSKKDSLASLRMLGITMYEQGDYAVAELAFRREVEGLYKSGTVGLDILTSTQWLGQSLYYVEDYPKAELYFRQVVDGRVKALGPGHIDTLTSLEWLGRSLYWQERYSDAVPVFSKAFEGREATLGSSDEHTLKSLEWLGQSLHWNGEYAKAEAAFRQVVEGRNKDLGPTSEETHRSYEWLGRSLYWSEKYGDAVVAFRQASEGRKVSLGDTHTHTLTSLEWLGRALYWNKEYRESELAFRGSFEGRKITLGLEDLHTLTTLEWLGRSLYYQEEYAKAETAFRQVFRERKVALGIDHASTLAALEWLGKSVY